MLKRVFGNLVFSRGRNAPDESRQLEQDGYAVLRGVFTKAEIIDLQRDIDRVFEEFPRDDRVGDKRSTEEDEMYRYEMLNRSALCQVAVGNKAILDVIDPLLGDDCHVIANTAWRNTVPGNGPQRGQPWHIDAGPHVPLPRDVVWPEDIPHPVFAIGAHLFLRDCDMADGPTGVIPRSHLSGQLPPYEERFNDLLQWRGRGTVALTAKAGDVALFVSDAWHRRLPSGQDDKGRYFLQAHYARRDFSQRLKTTEQVNQLNVDSYQRALSEREKHLVGLHQPGFYDG